MLLTLTKRRDATEKGPMIVMVEYEGAKKLVEFELGKPVTVDDELGYLILGDKRFTGQFAQGDGAKSLSGAHYKNKSASAEVTKDA